MDYQEEELKGGEVIQRSELQIDIKNEQMYQQKHPIVSQANKKDIQFSKTGKKDLLELGGGDETGKSQQKTEAKLNPTPILNKKNLMKAASNRPQSSGG